MIGKFERVIAVRNMVVGLIIVVIVNVVESKQVEMNLEFSKWSDLNLMFLEITKLCFSTKTVIFELFSNK